MRIKRFFGTSENAAKTRLRIAVSVCVLVAIIRKKLELDTQLYRMLQVLSVMPFEKNPPETSTWIRQTPTPNNQLKRFKNFTGH